MENIFNKQQEELVQYIEKLKQDNTKLRDENDEMKTYLENKSLFVDENHFPISQEINGNHRKLIDREFPSQQRNGASLTPKLTKPKTDDLQHMSFEHPRIPLTIVYDSEETEDDSMTESEASSVDSNTLGGDDLLLVRQNRLSRSMRMLRRSLRYVSSPARVNRGDNFKFQSFPLNPGSEWSKETKKKDTSLALIENPQLDIPRKPSIVSFATTPPEHFEPLMIKPMMSQKVHSSLPHQLEQNEENSFEEKLDIDEDFNVSKRHISVNYQPPYILKSSDKTKSDSDLSASIPYHDLHVQTNGNENMPMKKRRLFRLITVGDSGVGKSSIVKRFCYQHFSKAETTVGLDIESCSLVVNSTICDLQIWDTAGQERFRSVPLAYFRKADGIILVYDCCNSTSFLSIQNWIQSIRTSNNPDLPVILVANKIDIRQMQMQNNVPAIVPTHVGEQIAQKHGLFFLETSAKTDQYINEVFQIITRVMLENEEHDINKFRTDDSETVKQKRCCTIM